MNVSRRRVLATSAVACVLGHTTAKAATTATYQYDALGRLIRVTFNDGKFVVYSYDAAGNRTIVIHSDGNTFTATLQITDSGPVNLRDVANTAGYTGAQHANITFQVESAVTITGNGGAGNGGAGVDTGVWSSDVLSISLALQVSGRVYGGGGGGGSGAGDGASGTNGSNGGDAVYCRENLNIIVNSGGQLRAGGGGGGGGDAWVRNVGGEPNYFNGGGGGGGFPNGHGGPHGGATGSNGANGTTSGGGVGGSPGNAMPSTRINGAGGAGGGIASAGSMGVGASGSGGSGTWTSAGAGLGGTAGYAVRKNGENVTVTNNGTISGVVG